MIKEWGGYLPFELNEKYQEYFIEIGYTENDLVRLDCGRSAFWYAAKCINPEKVYVPYLNCKNSTDPFDALNIKYEYYKLDDRLMPVNINPGNNDALLWVNYYGNANKTMIREIEKYTERTNVIVDYCHAFYAMPIDRAWNCYSMRKFFGVSDGAYLIRKNIPKIDIPDSISSDNILFILECIEKGTNICYEKSLHNEERLGHECRKMSILTNKIIKTIDYLNIKKIRRDNFLYLHEKLAGINEFFVNTLSETHMYYPLLITSDEIRQKLVSKHIYTPTWWRHVPYYFDNENNVETQYSKYMLMLPIDQRYNKNDMEEISKIVYKEYEGLCQ